MQLANKSFALLEVNGNSIDELLLQVAKVRPLGGDATRPIWIVPPCHKAPGRLVTLYLKCNFFHGPDLDYSTSPIEHVIL
jgi:hypothetical protein